MSVCPDLLQRLQCPDCGHRLAALADEQIQCSACAHVFPVRDGVPRFVSDTTATARSFGYMWGRQAAIVSPPTAPSAYHLQAMQDALDAAPLRGLILDAGCGEGIDLSMVALDPACEVVGLELSSGGIETSLARTKGLPRAHLIQADLLRMPIASETFDGAYSYGVVHHTPDPNKAVQEIARTMKRGAPLLLYVYEDFADRSWLWRGALAAANSVRLMTTHLPPPLLMGLCTLLSPIVYALCTLPSRRFRWAARFPYRHGTSPSSLRGDLYDRLSAPIEKRYSREGARRLAHAAGLEVLAVAQRRGWMVYAQKPL